MWPKQVAETATAGGVTATGVIKKVLTIAYFDRLGLPRLS